MEDELAWRRRQESLQVRAASFAREYGDSLRCDTGHPAIDAPCLLSVSSYPPSTETEVCLLKAFAVAGWQTVPVIMNQPEILQSYYGLIRPTAVCNWAEFLPDATEFTSQAGSLLESCRSLEDILALRDGAVRIGGHATSMARRQWRRGRLDLDSASVRTDLERFLARSMAAAHACRSLLALVKPAMVLAVDTVYTPKGEILDCCVDAGIPLVRWYPAHRSDKLMFKRYTAGNRDHDLNSLSDESWRYVRSLPWNAQMRKRVDDELTGSYAKGDWYGESATQFDRKLVAPDEVQRRLGLDPTKRTGFIFAHISWDASFGRGQDLFESYEEWLVESVRAACQNDAMQWVIKVHPAHVGKSEVDFWQGEPSEQAILRERIGPLPSHVHVMPADTDISTNSIFGLIDVALTVRGTAGLEAALRGIPTITGGAGRYDRKGFTVDSDTTEQYLARLQQLQNEPRLNDAQIELAYRYAYGLFCLRPLSLTTMTLEYDRQHGVDTFFNRVQVRNITADDWRNATDLLTWSGWATLTDAEDFMSVGEHVAR